MALTVSELQKFVGRLQDLHVEATTGVETLVSVVRDSAHPEAVATAARHLQYLLDEMAGLTRILAADVPRPSSDLHPPHA